MRADGVQEVTVVAHHEDGVLEVGQPVLQPCHGLEVQIVGGLVEEQVVGVSEQCLGQQDAHFLIGAHVLHQHVVPVLFDSEAREKGGGVALGVPALEFGELLLQLGGLDAVFVAEVRLGVEGVFLRHDVVKHGVSAHHGVDDGVFVEFKVVLAQHAQALAGAESHAAGGGLKLSRQNLHQRGLSRAVGSDYAVAVAVVESQVHVLEENSLPELHT